MNEYLNNQNKQAEKGFMISQHFHLYNKAAKDDLKTCRQE